VGAGLSAKRLQTAVADLTTQGEKTESFRVLRPGKLCRNERFHVNYAPVNRVIAISGH
jgi:hypothetical protein